MQKVYIRIVHKSFMKKVVLLIALTSLLQGCRSTPRAVDHALTPIGKWSVIAEGEESDFCGIELLEDGRARSINLIALNYEKWKQRGDTLLLFGKSVTDDAEQNFIDTMRILKVTRSKMVVQEQDYRWEMVKIPS